MIRSVDLVKTSTDRRAVVVFTDGEDTASHASPTSVRTALQINNVLLYLVAQGKAATDMTLRDQLTKLVEETGGRALFSFHMSSLKDHFADTVSPLEGTAIFTLALQPPMPEIADRVARRVETQFARGIADEVRGLLARGGPEVAHPLKGLVSRMVLQLSLIPF